MLDKDLALRWFKVQVLPLALIFAVVFGFRDAVADWYDVPSGSMLPTLQIGDRIAVDKTAYGVRLPFTPVRVFERGRPAPGEIVTFPSPADGTRLVKRVIARGGSTVALRDGELWIDGRRVARREIDGAHFVDSMPRGMKHLRAYRERNGTADHVVLDLMNAVGAPEFGPVEVPADHVLVLGDNRDRSADSRFFGFVPERAIEGRVVGVAFSLDHDEDGDFAWAFRGDRFLRDPDRPWSDDGE